MAHPRHQRDLDAPASENPYADSPADQTPTPSETPRRSRATRAAAPLAALAVASAAVFGVLSAGTDEADAGARSTGGGITSAIGDVVDRRVETVSRGSARNADDPSTLADNPNKLQQAYNKADRRTATFVAVKRADDKQWTTADLNLWTLPGGKAKKVGLLGEEKKVLVTGRRQFGRDEVVVQGTSRWVTQGYLADEKPAPEPVVQSSDADSTGSTGSTDSTGSTGSTGTPDAGGTCTNGTSLSPGVSPNLDAVHEAVCANFPEITTYGDFRGDGEHGQGRAVDIMVSGARGQQVADFVRANAGSLGVEYVIFSQRIWSTQRSSEGWRGMSDRGSTTANHYDHVHVTVH